MERIVLDTNCLIQSISPRSPYRRIWDSFFDGTNLLCVTTSILNEYEEILNLLTNVPNISLMQLLVILILYS